MSVIAHTLVRFVPLVNLQQGSHLLLTNGAKRTRLTDRDSCHRRQKDTSKPNRRTPCCCGFYSLCWWLSSLLPFQRGDTVQDGAIIQAGFLQSLPLSYWLFSFSNWFNPGQPERNGTCRSIPKADKTAYCRCKSGNKPRSAGRVL
jgi:hypothetical protein